MTERRSSSESKLSPTTAKVMLTVAAVAGTLGGYAVLAAREPPRAQAEAASPPGEPSDDGLPTLVEISFAPQSAAEGAPPTEPLPVAATRPMRVVNQPPPRPITLTRSSR